MESTMSHLDKLRERFKHSISFRANDRVICEAIKKDIFPIYKGLISKPDVWNLTNDELCDEIEDRIKQLLDKKESEGKKAYKGECANK